MKSQTSAITSMTTRSAVVAGLWCLVATSVWASDSTSELQSPNQVMAPSQRCAQWAARLDSLEGKVEWQAPGQAQWQAAQLEQTFCYGDKLVIREKRAALRLANHTVVRLNENSTLTLVPPDAGFWVELTRGAAHFLTRTPKSFTVKAPYLNAAVEGTEFLVAAETNTNRVGVLEGRVRTQNAGGAVTLNAGQEASAGSARELAAPITVQLNHFVTWAMYFPPLPMTAETPPDIRRLLSSRQAQLALSSIENNQTASADLIALGAGLALNHGNTERAKRLIDRALVLAPQNAHAQAVNAMMLLGIGEAERGRQLAATNALQNQQNASAQIAYSYALQSRGQLQDALMAAEKAYALDGDNPQTAARVAELYLAVGQRQAAQTILHAALAKNPGNPRLVSFNGFAELNKLAGKEAQTLFEQAVILDSGDPLAQLGLGLSLIQQGQIDRGREHIELAVVLDPANSLLRSYLGRSYRAESRDDLASTQYELAQNLDPQDPTPWFYQAQLKQDQYQLTQALELIETSIDKSANRAVYRSQNQLDSDAAARIAAKSSIYRALGFDHLATSTAATAVDQAPADYVGHRALSVALGGQERLQSARAKEALQATALAPISAQPLPPAFSEYAMQVVPGSGPHQMGLNEYNPLFNQQGVTGLASVLASANNTRATEGQINLVGQKAAFTAGQYHYSSDGVRENNDRDYLVNEGLLRYQVVEDIQLQLEVSRRQDDTGALADQYIDSSTINNSRNNSVHDRQALRGIVNLTPHNKMLYQISKQDEEVRFKTSAKLAFGSVSSIQEKQKHDILSHNLAWLHDSHIGSINLGAYSYRDDKDILTSISFAFNGQVINFPDEFIVEPSKYDKLQVNYGTGDIFDALKLELSLANVKYQAYEADDNDVLPRLGLRYNHHNMDYRLSVGEDVAAPLEGRRDFFKDFFAGLPAVFDDVPFTKSRFAEGAINFSLGRLATDLTGARREIDQLYTIPNDNGQEFKPKFFDTLLGLRFSLADQFYGAISAGVSHNKNEQDRGVGMFSFRTVPASIETLRVPLTYKYVNSTGLEFNFLLEHVKQETELEIGLDDSFVTSTNEFLNVETGLAWHKEFGTVELRVLNVLDEKIYYYEQSLQNISADVSMKADPFVTERTLVAKVRAHF